MAGAYPKIVWTLWHQGWQSAPEVARASHSSWRRLNPGWQINALDQTSLSRFLPDFDLLESDPRQTREALSDRIRVELLSRFGGVWVDATTICATPLDQWLPSRMASGFFAFRKPGPDRELSSWFLASGKGHHIVEKWREAVSDFWRDQKTQQLDYFWFHRLFSDLCESDAHFAALWLATPKHSANHAFHFGPDDPRLLSELTSEYVSQLRSPPEPVFKLTHKFSSPPLAHSLFATLCSLGKGEFLGSEPVPSRSPKRLLVTWYGSFRGHGTIGDQRSLESAVTHLIARGHVVEHASASELSIAGARRVDWQASNPDDYAAVVFVCGPILSFHPETSALFARFRSRPLVGLGVSLLPTEHAYFSNPFDVVFARQGAPRRFGDLAVVAPIPQMARRRDRTPRVGISLRGAQIDYGEELCMWREAEALVGSLATAAIYQGGEIVQIENHLARSERSPDEMEKAYADCDLIITTRFHGAITALRHDVPFVAIDQIRGGAKVYDLLANLGWDHVYRIEATDTATLQLTARELMARPDRVALRRARDRNVDEANATLASLDEWLESLTSHGFPP